MKISIRAAVNGGLVLAVLLGAPPAVAASRYIFTVFKGDSVAAEKLSVYTSTDGLNFKLLSDTGYGGPTGVLRDPSIMKHSDGKYYVAHTVQSWDTNSSSFAIASSSDLLKWTNVVTVPAQVPNAAHTWAPEWFKDSDGSINLIVSIDQTTEEWAFRAYKFTASDDSLTKWGAPTAIGIGPNYIDTFIVKVGATYHAFPKNETTKYIEHATATSLTGPWTFVGKDDWAGWGSGKEGPALFQLASGEWRIIMDRYSGGGCLYATSSDLSKWSGVTEIPGGLSGVVRHGTILREDDTPDAGADAAADVAPDVRGDDVRREDGSMRDVAPDLGSGGAGGGGGSGAGGATGKGGAGGTTATGAGGGGGATGGTSGGTSGTGGAAGTGGTIVTTVRGSGGSGGSGGGGGGGGATGSGGASASGGSAGSGGAGGSSMRADAAPGGAGGGGNEGGSSGCACALGGARSGHQLVGVGVLALLLFRRRRR